MAKTHQARDKTAHRSHNAPDSRKHNIFEGPGAQTCKTHALEGPRLEPGGVGPASLAARENNDLALKSQV